ncbi:MAG: YlbF family regulator [Defluviitaleaceae bacterium]|nr:YlbF family regulator [Defluviitaleaceae bacterium]
MIYQKARELAELINNSDYAAILNERKEDFEKNITLKNKFEAFSSTKASIKARLIAKTLKPEEYKLESKKLDKIAEELEAEEDLIALLNAEDEFNDFVNNVLSMLKTSIQGGEGGCSSGGCGGCSVKSA